MVFFLKVFQNLYKKKLCISSSDISKEFFKYRSIKKSLYVIVKPIISNGLFICGHK
jgi:hypothetical protein